MDIDKKTERKIAFYAIGILLLMSFTYLIIYYIKGLIDKEELLSYVVFAISTNGVATYLIFIGNFEIDRLLEKRFPWSNYIITRLILEYVFIILYSLSVMTVIGLVFELIFGAFEEGSIFTLLKQTLVVVIIITTGIVFAGFIKGWKNAQIDIQKLEKETANARFEALKANIKPHFLFNSLNTLSSLIRVNPTLAEEYNSGLSDIYRYILKSNDEMLVCVAEELKFLKTYLSLQKIRYGDTLNYSMNLAEDTYDKLIPSLTLQLIVENALKHNTINEDNTLKISLSNVDDVLIVKNNLQPKIGEVKSSGFGIKNIIERYTYFTDRVPEFIMTENEYIAKIPLLDD